MTDEADLSALGTLLADPVTADDVLARAAAAAAEIAPAAAAHDRDATFPHQGVHALWRTGLGNLTLPPGRDLLAVSRAVRLIGAADAAVALIWVMHLIHLELVSDPAFGLADDVRDAIVSSSLAGPALINALRVEPELGTPARGGVTATTATPAAGRDGELGWTLRGHKIYCTGSHGLRWMLVWAATASDDPGGVRVGPFVVAADAPGIEIRETWDHLGMRASASHDVVFHDTPVPAGHVAALAPLHAPSAGQRDALTLGAITVLLTSIYLGVATAARDWLTVYLNERAPANLGAPLATLPRFQTAVGEIDALLATSGRLLDSLARDLDAGGDTAAEAVTDAGVTKVVVCRNVIAATERAVALVGNPGLSLHNPLQRHHRDALCSRIHTPQEDTILLAAGRRTLNLDRQGC